MNIILEGITGSKAYGLDTKNSDTDIKGIFVLPNEKLLSLHKSAQTINQTNPDIEYHEVEKFMGLAMKCNPTILELLYLDSYQILTEAGKLLVDNRDKFLSKQVLKTYGGYALDQAKKLYRKGMVFARYEKHSRHCFRLLMQGRELLETGKLTVKVTKEQRKFLFMLGNREPFELVELFEEEFKKFDSIKTDLPDKPDYNEINTMLLAIRFCSYERNK